MGKFVYAVLTVFLIEMALYLFGGTTYSQSSLFSLLLNPENLTANPFYTGVILIIIAGFAASAIVPGNLLSFSVYAPYAVAVTAVVTFALSIVHFYTFTYGQLSGIMTTSLAHPITVIIVAPLLVFYTFASLEWIRGNT